MRLGSQRVARWAAVTSLGLAVALGSSLGALGCGKRGGAKRIARDKDASAVVVIAPTPDQIVFTDEAEPNDGVAQANVVDAGAGVRGTLDGEEDVDLYRLTVKAPGFLSALVSGIDGVDLIVDLRDAEGKVLVRSDRGPEQTIEGMPNYPVEAGDYLIGVSEFVKKRKPAAKSKGKGKAKAAPPPDPGRLGPSPTYELVVRVADTATDGHEIEPNSKPTQVKDILLGEEVVGYMGWNRDVDMWRLALEGFAPDYSLDLDLQAVPGVTFRLEVQDAAGKPVLVRNGIKDEGLIVRNLLPGASGKDGPASGDNPADGSDGSDGDGDKDGDKDESESADTDSSANDTAADAVALDPNVGQRFYFVKLSARRSSPVDAYRLRMSTRILEPDEEREPNDDAARASVLSEGDIAAEGAIRGFLTPGDKDVYALVVAEPILLDVKVNPGVDIDVRLAITDGAGNALAKANAGRRGAGESVTAVRVPRGTVLIEVGGVGAVGDAAYELSFTTELDDNPPATPASGDPNLLDDAYGDE